MSTPQQPPAPHDSADDRDLDRDEGGNPAAEGRRVVPATGHDPGPQAADDGAGAAARPATETAARDSATGASGAEGGEGVALVRRKVRRAPNFVAFVVTGALLGFVVGAVVDLFGGSMLGATGALGAQLASMPYSAATTFGFLSTLGAVFGAAVGLGVALLLDRRG